MYDYELPSDFDIQGLSLIDVTVEDDCLIDPPLLDHLSDGELEEDETGRNGRRKLHKSVTWDSSFFSSAAFLEPNEFSSRKDAKRSRDLSTMLEGEALTQEHPEADFDEDIKASTQKCNRMSGNAVNKELGTKDSRNVSSPNKSEYPNHDKVNRKAALRKLNIATKDPGKTMKQVPTRPQTSKSFGRSAALTSPRHKPPKVLGSRASLTAKGLIMKKDPNSAIDRGTRISKAPALDGSRNILPRTTSSRSSPLSSPMIRNSSMDTTKQNNDSGLVNSSSSTSTSTHASKSAAKGRSRLGHLAHSTLLKSPTNSHSSISVASSSCSELSSESSLSSPTSTANKKSKVVRGSLGSGFHKGLVTDSGAKQVLDSQSRHTRHPSMRQGDEVTDSLDESESKVSDGSSGLLQPAVIKPSALRPPSPKLTFSNGVSQPSPKLAFSNGVSLPSPKFGVNPPSPKLAFSNGVSLPSTKLGVNPPSPKLAFSNGVSPSPKLASSNGVSLPSPKLGVSSPSPKLASSNGVSLPSPKLGVSSPSPKLASSNGVSLPSPKLEVNPPSPKLAFSNGVSPPSPKLASSNGVSLPLPKLGVNPPSPKLVFSNGVSPPSPKLASSNGVNLPSPKLGVNPPSPKLAFSNGVSPPSPKLASSNGVSLPSPKLGVNPPSPKLAFSNGVSPPSPKLASSKGVSLPSPKLGVNPPSPKLAFSNGVSPPSPKLASFKGVSPPSPKLPFSNGVSPPSPKVAFSNGVSYCSVPYGNQLLAKIK